jgi:HD superfamily phosphohydrolase|tara:strand:- start:5072 stop:6220 length:1149 start_codon:yes stop_codon:yes gene_type:complete
MVRVRDPIHDYIDLTSLEGKLVDTPAYQRLRWIKQLGPINLVYPGANHTRHEHSMGTCHVVGKMADSIGLNSYDKQLVSVAGLLHDLGHTAFSHLGDEIDGVEDHVIRTTNIISNTELSDIISNEGLNPNEVNQIIRGNHKLDSLVSGDLDGDRLDYLVRDAHYTGVSTGVDMGRLITTMSMHDSNLVIKEKGLPAVEALLTARSTMYQTVYFHSFARGAQLMLARAANYAISSGKFSINDFVTFTDHKFLSELNEAGSLSSKLCSNFENRKIVKRAVSITKEQIEFSGLEKSKKKEYEASIASKVGIDNSEIYVDIPSFSVMPGLKTKILKNDGMVSFARDESKLVSSLYEAQFDHWRCSVYGPSELRDEISAVSKTVLGV